MRRLAYITIALASLALATAPRAHAQVAITFNNDNEVRMFQQVLEAASGSQTYKAGGLEMANAVSAFNNKLLQAISQLRTPPQPNQPPAPGPAQ